MYGPGLAIVVSGLIIFLWACQCFISFKRKWAVWETIWVVLFHFYINMAVNDIMDWGPILDTRRLVGGRCLLIFFLV